MPPKLPATARILAIDDEQPQLDLLTMVLHSAGAERIRCTTDPERAVEIYRRMKPDIVLLDLAMWGVSGFDVLQALSIEVPPAEYTPVLVLSGDLSDSSRERALELGAKDFLSKPFHNAELVLRIANLLETRFLYQQSAELLQGTLTGVVSVLIDLLTALHPQTIERARRLRATVSHLCTELRLANAWEVELAAMLSHVGCLTLPAPTLHRVFDGLPLLPEEAQEFARHPMIGAALLGRIPRLASVAEIVRGQAVRFDQSFPNAAGSAPPLGCRILKAALDFEALVGLGMVPGAAIRRMQARQGWYDPVVLAAFRDGDALAA